MITLQSVGQGRLALGVADDGVGLPAEVDFPTVPSLGLQLVNSLTAQIEGEITLHRGVGTEFVIEFPIDGLKE